MRNEFLIDLNRCTGCWACAMACKVINRLDDEEFWITVRTNGSGEGIDMPQGKWPNLSMNWMPIYSDKCIDCAPRQKEGKRPFCEQSCPVHAITYGEDAEKHEQELRDDGFEIFELGKFEEKRKNVKYAKKETPRLR